MTLFPEKTKSDTDRIFNPSEGSETSKNSLRRSDQFGEVPLEDIATGFRKYNPLSMLLYNLALEQITTGS